jgi:glutaredoxin 3
MAHVKMYTTLVCPFCVRAKMLLKQQHMMATTGRRTVPQIFIGDTHVGGCDDLIALDQKGGLLPLLQAA